MTHIVNITARWRQLAQTAAGIIPSQVRGEPNKADAEALVSDLRVLARDVDALIEAYGNYAAFALGMSQSSRAECFRDVLSGAIDGNATFAIENAAEEYEQSKADRVADHRRALVAAE